METVRNRASRRKKNYSIVRKKKKLVKAISDDYSPKFDGQYIKGKLYSTPPEKAKNSKCYVYGNCKYSDQIRNIAADYKEKDYLYGT